MGAPEAGKDVLLRVTGICKAYGAVRALNNVSLSVSAGEVVGLIGDNGAGKSTLVKIISGVLPPDTGDIELPGRRSGHGSRRGAQSKYVSTIYQDLALCDNLDILANLYLGQERRFSGWLGWFRLLDRVEMEKQARALYEQLDFPRVEFSRRVANLSGGQRQAVAIAKAMVSSPRIVLLDEPTAALGVEQTAHVLSLVGRLRDAGLGIVIISHNLEQVLQVSDRVEVLRLGENAGAFKAATTHAAVLVAAMTGLDKVEGDGRQINV